MHVLVTGAGGFSGGHLACDLARRGFTVTATYRRTLPQLAGRSGGDAVRLVRCDLRAPDGLPAVDAVIHAAATSAWSGITVEEMVCDNVEATRALIRWAIDAGVGRIILASSMSVYGRILESEVNEDTPIIDPDAYGLSKRLCERMLEEVAGQMPGMALRLPGIIGRGAQRNFIASTLAALRRGEPINAFNPDAPFNNVVHVDDLGAFSARLLIRGWSGFDILTLGSCGETTVRNAIERLAVACGSHAPITFGSFGRPAFTISSRRAMSRYGYDPGEVGALLDRYAADEATSAQ